MAGKLSEAEWRRVDDFRRNWTAFCDCDPFPGADTFSERMEGAGFIELRVVTDDDLESSFAYERGIERGGMVWSLTPEGRTALAEDASRTNGGGDG